jgi:hypothetical protein
MTTLMVDVENKFKPFMECGHSNMEVGFDKKSRDNEDPKKELEKEKKCVITSSQFVFQ